MVELESQIMLATLVPVEKDWEPQTETERCLPQLLYMMYEEVHIT
jgi:hypothetical protein